MSENESNPAEEKKKEISFFNDLKQRRVPQILGIYVAAGWGIIQFVEWLVNRYMLSPSLIDLAFVILLSLIPSSVIVSYFHGKPGRDKWKKPEKIGIPLNVILTAFLVYFLFNGKYLGNVSQTVTVKDETGKNIERVIPKSQFRKKILLFYFKNETGDPSLDWVQYGLTHMLEFDLGQDVFIEAITPHQLLIDSMEYYIYEKIKTAGFPGAVNLPLLLKNKIAEEINMGYFLGGKFFKTREGYQVETSLFRVPTVKEVARRTIKGDDWFKLVDQISIRLKKDLEIPQGHLEELNDLPVAESFTGSPAAARFYTLGRQAAVFKKDWQQAQDYLEKALEEDASFAMAYLHLSSIYLVTNQAEKRGKIYDTLMTLLYKLPERMQFYIKMDYYQLKQEPRKQLALLKMLITLYPEDLEAYAMLAYLQTFGNRPDEAIATYRRMLEIDPHRHEIYRNIGALYEKKGEFQQALDYYNRFAGHFPSKIEAFTLLAGLHQQMGNYKQARDAYEKALLLNPGDIPTMTTLAQLDIDTGHFNEGYKRLQDTLQLGKTPQDLKTVYEGFIQFYQVTGQMKKTLEYIKLRDSVLKEYALPVMLLSYKAFSSRYYVLAGQEKEVLRELDDLSVKLDSASSYLLQIAYMNVYLETGNLPEVEKRISAVEQFIAGSGVEQLRDYLNQLQGRLLQRKGNYAAAAEKFEAALEHNPNNNGLKRRLASCFRQLKQFARAEDIIKKILKLIPSEPQTNLEMALIYLDTGMKDKALKHLQVALEVWKNADPQYKPAKLAREKLALVMDT